MLRNWAREASRDTDRAANWFSGNDESLRQESLPGRFTYSMPFATALVFGKWFNALALALFGALAAALACCCRRAGNAAKKVFVAATGFFILSMAVCGYLAYFGLVPPMLHTCVPLVSYGGGVIGIAWLLTGIVVGAVRGEGGCAG